MDKLIDCKVCRKSIKTIDAKKHAEECEGMNSKIK